MYEEIEETEGARKNLTKLLPVPTTSLEHYLAEISNYAILGRKEEYNLAMKYKKDGDLEAARKLITHNLRFVIKISNEYKDYGMNIMDLIQEGNIGLMKAVQRFDPTRGYRLISYAVWWIRAYIQNYIIRTYSLIKLGTTEAQRKLFYKLRSTKLKMGITDEKPTYKEYKAVAKKLKVPVESVIEMDQRIIGKELSLNALVSRTGEKATYMEFIEDQAASQEELISSIEEQEKVKKNLKIAVKSLNEREQYIVKNRLLKLKPLTLEVLSKELKISKERVRQIEKIALRKMRNFLETKGITSAL
ncbi:MAG TPA: RNA polymerase factor sigma-32 [Thermodesulfobacteriota bacterium]